MLRTVVPALLIPAVLIGCAPAPAPPADLDAIAESYVRLVLAVGEHDPGYVDAYYGPAERRAEVATEQLGLVEISERARAVLADLGEIEPSPDDEVVRLRHHFLLRQLEALVGYVAVLQGERLAFDDESRVLYDAVAPVRPMADYADELAELDRLLPGEGPIQPRLEAVRQEHVVPADRLDTVFRRAIEECRRRTLEHLELPPGESFEVEYVTDQPWGAYNWYQGSYHSLIQVNVDLPVRIDRIIHLAGHEGYPGHHVLNGLYEQRLVNDRGWVETTVYPLFSPESLMAEGTANVGVELIFPGDEQLVFERDVLYPLAGLDPATADGYWQIRQAVKALELAATQIARSYLDGEMDGDDAVAGMMEYSLMSRLRAEQRLSFLDHYRSYVINYTLGEELVERHLEARAGDDPAARWREFERLLTTPQVASSLDAAALDGGR